MELYTKDGRSNSLFIISYFRNHIGEMINLFITYNKDKMIRNDKVSKDSNELDWNWGLFDSMNRSLRPCPFPPFPPGDLMTYDTNYSTNSINGLNSLSDEYHKVY